MGILDRSLGSDEGEKFELRDGGVYGYASKPKELSEQVRDACNNILICDSVGNAAGMLCAILCFLISVICLAVATQPPSVWIATVITCLCIFILPLINSILATGKFSPFVYFSFITCPIWVPL